MLVRGGARTVDVRRAAPGAVRRLVLVALLSAVLPGAGHVALGHRRVGRALLAAWAVLLGLAALVLLVAWVRPGLVASAAVRPSLLGALSTALAVVAVGWAAAVVSAVLLAGPSTAGPRGPLLSAALVVALVGGAAVPVHAAREVAGAQQRVVERLFAEFPDDGDAARVSPEEALADGLLAVLLIGSDSDDDRVGTRTDTLMLAVLDVETARPVVFALPRNMQGVPFEEGSPMAAAFPDGFDCEGCYLNAVYEWAVEHPEALPGEADPGMAALTSAVEGVVDLPVDYHVMVDFDGFAGLVDALGGVRIDVQERLPIGGIDAAGREVRPSGWIEAGPQVLDGETALWYARSRRGSTDYARMARQRCLVGALRRQVEPLSLLRRYSAVAASTEGAVTTDVPRELLPRALELVLAARSEPIRSVSFSPPLVPDTAHPDFAAIRGVVRSTLAAPAAEPGPAAAREPAPADAEPASRAGEADAPGATPEQPVEQTDETCSYG